jgi:signal transduction histidine kinase
LYATGSPVAVYRSAIIPSVCIRYIDATFEHDGGFPRLPRDLELALFRILQEALTNVHRHSGSTKAQVRLLTGNGVAVLEVQDQGKCMPPELQEESGFERTWGIGLRGMSERMHQLGGRLEIVSSPQKGTTVRAVAPMEPRLILYQADSESDNGQ